ncbi:MAG: hypothetical protein V1722_01690 [Candidatus Micrarchaeota archaeon]
MSITRLQVREFLIYLGLIGLIAIAFSSFVNASFEEVKSTDVNVISPSSLVVVNGDLNFDAVLPGYNYERVLNVSLNLAPSSLNGLTANNVEVFVKVSALKYENSSIVLESNNETGKVIRFSFNCIVVNGTCGVGSISSQIVKVKLAAPMVDYPYSDKVIVNASLSNIPVDVIEAQSRDVLAALSVLQKQLEEVKKNIESSGKSTQLNGNISSIESLFNDAQRSAVMFDVNGANKSLSKAESDLEKLQLSTNDNKSPAANGTMFTAHVLGYNLPISWEAALIVLLAIALVSVYIHHASDGKKRKHDINKFMKDAEQ